MLKVPVIAGLLISLLGCRLEIQEEAAPVESTTDQTSVLEETSSDADEVPVVLPEEILKQVPSPQVDHYHRVESGETLGAIAERYGTTAEKLTQVNGLGAPDDLTPGQRIYIPRSEITETDKETKQ